MRRNNVLDNSLLFNESMYIYIICLRNDVICIMHENQACLMSNGIANGINMSSAFKRFVPLTNSTDSYASTNNVVDSESFLVRFT